jgi:hypothetical protein
MRAHAGDRDREQRRRASRRGEAIRKAQSDGWAAVVAVHTLPDGAEPVTFIARAERGRYIALIDHHAHVGAVLATAYIRADPGRQGSA